MDVSGTISSYLESEDKFDYLFWSSYSMDPITIEFLFKNDSPQKPLRYLQ